MVLTEDRLYSEMVGNPLQSQKGTYAIEFHAMGTTCKLMFSASSRGMARAFQEQVLHWLAGFEARYSRFLPDSLISEINRAAGHNGVATDSELDSMFALCDWFHWMTKGVFDPTMLPLAQLWDYHRKHTSLPADADIERERKRVGWGRVEREPGRVFLPEPGMALDLGGIGKEYAVDRVAEMAQAAGLSNFLIDFGHDVRTHGEPPGGGPWRIGLEHPRDPGRCWGGVAVRERAVATSGIYRRHFELDGVRYCHILDPRTGWPIRNEVEAVSVIAATCTEAGILSTTALVLGAPEGRSLIESAARAVGCIWSNGTRMYTRGFDEYVL